MIRSADCFAFSPERLRSHACIGGWAFVGYIDEYGEKGGLLPVPPLRGRQVGTQRARAFGLRLYTVLGRALWIPPWRGLRFAPR
jgi:hypothetical protein